MEGESGRGWRKRRFTERKDSYNRQYAIVIITNMVRQGDRDVLRYTPECPWVRLPFSTICKASFWQHARLYIFDTATSHEFLFLSNNIAFPCYFVYCSRRCPARLSRLPILVWSPPPHYFSEAVQLQQPSICHFFLVLIPLRLQFVLFTALPLVTIPVPVPKTVFVTSNRRSRLPNQYLLGSQFRLL